MLDTILLFFRKVWKGILLALFLVSFATAVIFGPIAVVTLMWDTLVWLTNANFKHTGFRWPLMTGTVTVIAGYLAALFWARVDDLRAWDDFN